MIHEQRIEGEAPEAYVHRLATEKAAAVAIAPGEVVLGADTVVVLDQHVLEKPRDAADACRMLDMLSGREHDVITGISFRSLSSKVTDQAVTRVKFAPLTQTEIADYVATGEPMDKAGAYAIQGCASKFVESIEGCFFNVMGLPISLVYRHLKAFGHP